MPRRQSKEEFVAKAQAIFGNQFDYSKSDYVNSRTPIEIVCYKHGTVKVVPKNHLCYKTACDYCKGIRHNQQTFLEKANEIHRNKFDYSKSIYESARSKIVIICKTHGEFEQAPDKHLNCKQGCPKCDISCRKDASYFIKKANEVHNHYYDYSQTVFTRIFDLVTIICPVHGEFRQLPSNHLYHKQGCKSCNVPKSRKEKSWLDSIGLPDDKDHRSVSINVLGKRYIVDGFDPTTKTVYEFDGDYWHGNPNSFDPKMLNAHMNVEFGELYARTLKKTKVLEESGYRVVSIWESEYDTLVNRLKRPRLNSTY